MKVLVACEFSGVVRDAFAARGHDAWSCDLLPSETPGQHIQGDAVEAANSQQWDLLIAHPPCTYLCNSGVRWLYGKAKRAEGQPDAMRWQQMMLAAQFFLDLWNANIQKASIENPIMHRHAARLIGDDYAQIIQPWQFGHGEIKQTCLWLRGLPLLKPTEIVSGRAPRVHRAPPGPNRWKERSRTLPGIARAMAEQWS